MHLKTNISEIFQPAEWNSQVSVYENLLNKELPYKFVAAIHGNQYFSLNQKIDFDESMLFIPTNSFPARKILEKTLAFIIAAIIKKLDPQLKPVVAHVINNGLYCLIENKAITPDFLNKIEKLMNKTIRSNLLFIPHKMDVNSVEHNLVLQNDNISVNLIKKIKREKIVIQEVAGIYFLSEYPLAPTTRFFKNVRVHAFGEGFTVTFNVAGTQPRPLFYYVQKKLFEIYSEYSTWTSVTGINYITDLNESLKSRKIREIIHISEAFHEKKLTEITANIVSRYPHRRLILIAGPSSSGKTTFSKRLGIHLKTYGLHSNSLSLDNYFVDRDKTPLDENGNPDFESIYALDLESLNSDLLDLLQGKGIKVPEYDFKRGVRSEEKYEMQLKPTDVLILEGIHGLNEMLTRSIPAHMKYKIYVSAITTLNLDPYNRISSADNRLIRRIVRDSKFRNHSALDSLKMWISVRKGEEKNIFPFQEEADIMFNSALVYEWVYLKKYVAPLLKKVPKNCTEYAEALRLRSILTVIDDYDNEEYLPPTSILREFVGKSSLHY